MFTASQTARAHRIARTTMYLFAGCQSYAEAYAEACKVVALITNK